MKIVCTLTVLSDSVPVQDAYLSLAYGGSTQNLSLSRALRSLLSASMLADGLVSQITPCYRQHTDRVNGSFVKRLVVNREGDDYKSELNRFTFRRSGSYSMLIRARICVPLNVRNSN